MIIEIFQWFESPLFVSPVVLVNLFYLSCLNDFLNQSKNLMNTDRDTLYQVLKKKTFAFIHGTHDKLSCECLFGVIPFDIWSYCENLKVLWSVHVLPGIFYFEILILGRLSVSVCDEFSGQFGNMYMCQSEESMERGDERRGETAGQVWNLTKLNTKSQSELFK